MTYVVTTQLTPVINERTPEKYKDFSGYIMCFIIWISRE